MKIIEIGGVIFEYKEIPGYDGSYGVTKYGQVLGLTRIITKKGGQRCTIKAKLRKASKDRKGYMSVMLSKDGEGKRYLLHKLVAISHIGPRPEGFCIAHNDGNKENNSCGNLRYCTYSENEADKHLHGTAGVEENHSQAKLTRGQAEMVIKLEGLLKAPAVAKIFGLNYKYVHDIWRGKTWRSIKRA